MTSEKSDTATMGEMTLDLLRDLDRYRARLPEAGELLKYLYTFTGSVVPYKKICEGHNAPFEYVAESLYGSGWTLALGPRSGGKTYDAGLSVTLEAYHRAMDVRILGGSGDQSARMYEEFTGFLESGFNDRVIGAPLQSRTTFAQGNKVQMLVQSHTSVHGPHVPRVYLDEVEWFDTEIYEAALSICQSRKGKKARVDVTSTRSRPNGLMGRLWEMWPSAKFIWCFLEVLEACTGDRSCSRCPLASDCPGKEKMAGAVGYYLIDDAIDKKTHMSSEAWDAEWLCKEPRKEGLTYPAWDWEIHTGLVPYDPDLPLIRAFDPGQTCALWIQPRAVTVGGKPRTQYRVVFEKRWGGAAPSRMVSEVKQTEKARGWEPKLTYVDPAAKWFVDELTAGGIDASATDNDVDKGIGMMRNLLELKSDDNEPLFVADRENCKMLITEMGIYHMAGGKIIKKKDHGPDAARYCVASHDESEKQYIRMI